ncbi:1-pyrroline-5-carboxylate dehydrogenase [Leptospira fletcheri]|uniref:1-pyrroline-5-carboxylate dehydrogenase n=1 Tax=Leptospira fletcheri TaxID=2484981 RepID=A0A4R9GFQ6_9LEPT|nr:proline dehydrogenase family protein [Leptospira fletcheri]TGK11490.1 1-pyrroline-5-carboxylate dehydrogenase [Leptospira fletcheri]
MNPGQERSENAIPSLEEKTIQKGISIFSAGDEFEPSIFSSYSIFSKSLSFLDDRPELKVQAFRFADVFPTLRNWIQVADHIRLYFLQTRTELPVLLKFAMRIALSNPITAFLLSFITGKMILFFAKFFIVGRNYDQAKNTVYSRYKLGISNTIDILGEAVLSEREAGEYSEKYLSLLEGIAGDPILQKLNPNLPNPSANGNISVKCSALFSQLDPLAFEYSVSVLKERLRPIFRSAVTKNVFVNLDLEQYETKDLILTAGLELFSEQEFLDYPHFGLVIQAYLLTSLQDLEKVITVSGKRKFPLTVRLVKGAYWEFEVVQSKQKGWEPPVFLTKPETDLNYEKCAELLLRSHPRIFPAFATHNVRSMAHALALAEELNIPKKDYEIQMLYGMGDPYKKALRKFGISVREYSPIGEVIPGMAYLVRRLLENSTNEGFLKNIYSKKKDRIQLLEIRKKAAI